MFTTNGIKHLRNDGCTLRLDLEGHQGRTGLFSAFRDRSLLDVQMKMLNNQLDINLESWVLAGIRDIPW